MMPEAWSGPLLGAILAVVLSFVAGYRIAQQKLAEVKSDLERRLDVHFKNINELKASFGTSDREHAIKMLSLEKDVTALQGQVRQYVTAYELERRFETFAARKDELRRRIILLERLALGHDLDGTAPTSSIQVKRSSEV